MTQFEQGSGGLPQGQYHVVYIGDEPYVPKAGDKRNPDWGESIFLKWRVTHGKSADQEVSRLMPANSTPKTYLGQFATALLGRQIRPGESFDLDEAIGVHGQLYVGPNPKKPEDMVPLTFTRDAVQPQPPVMQPVQPPVAQPQPPVMDDMPFSNEPAQPQPPEAYSQPTSQKNGELNF